MRVTAQFFVDAVLAEVQTVAAFYENVANTKYSVIFNIIVLLILFWVALGGCGVLLRFRGKPETD